MPENSKKKRKKRRPGILANIRKIMGLNVGTIMFGVLFLYMLFSTVLYMTSGHIESYQVNSGPLSRNETYTGLAIREESIMQEREARSMPTVQFTDSVMTRFRKTLFPLTPNSFRRFAVI